MRPPPGAGRGKFKAAVTVQLRRKGRVRTQPISTRKERGGRAARECEPPLPLQLLPGRALGFLAPGGSRFPAHAFSIADPALAGVKAQLLRGGLRKPARKSARELSTALIE